MHRRPFHRLVSFAALAALVLAVSPARADVLAYWSFNNSDETPDANVVGAAMTVKNNGVPFFFTEFTFDPGTTVNAQLGFPAGVAPADHILFALTDTLDFEISGLDFTNYTGITLSFATLKADLVSIFTSLTADYKIGGGSFTGAENLTLPDGTWSSRGAGFSGALDGQSDVTIRVRLGGIIDAGAVAAFDNFTISGSPVPEPAEYAAAAGLLALGAVMVRRISARSHRR